MLPLTKTCSLLAIYLRKTLNMLILFRFKITIENVMFDYLAGTQVRVFFDLLTLMFLF